MMMQGAKKIILIGLAILSLGGIAVFGYQVIHYLAWGQTQPKDWSDPIIVNAKQFAEQTTILPVTVPYQVEVVATDLFVPWSLVFTSSERILVTERSGTIRIIERGQLQVEPLVEFTEVSSSGEEGLMGLTKDPHYDDNHWLYLCLAYDNAGQLMDKVIRVNDNGTSVSDATVLFDAIPAAQYHAGCRVQFGPDEKLYITTGDATDKNIAQDLSSLGGKILRINADGSIPSDNPWSNSPVWSYGHRNSQGLAWHPVTQQLFATEHGPSGFDGPAGGDEINLIERGANYGWPLVSHTNTKADTVVPLLVFTPAVAPAAALFYSGDVFPQFKNNLLFTGLKGEGIYRVILSDRDNRSVVSYERINDINVGRIREIIQSPDGLIYFTTSNRDGRGEVRGGDDKMYRLQVK